jgi:GT2 family glycosyltransferase
MFFEPLLKTAIDPARQKMKIASYIITYRHNNSPDRLENFLAVTRWLAQLDDIETIIVEQDASPTLQPDAIPSADKYIFAFNPGPFNRSWGLNVGAKNATTEVLVLADADVLAPAGIYPAIQICRKDFDVAKPYQRIIDLNAEETAHVRAGDWNFIPTRPANSPLNREARGEHVVFAGGVFLIRRDFFWKTAGFDERFIGWGGEDNAMTARLAFFKARYAISTNRPALHLFHPRSKETTFDQPHYNENLKIIADYRRFTPADFTQLCDQCRPLIGNVDKHRPA